MSATAPAITSHVRSTFARRLADLKAQGRKLLTPFAMLYDGGPDATRRQVELMVQEGADVIELGIPYSDPVADGLTIQGAAARAFAAGFTLAKGLKLIHDIRRDCPVPLVAMTYVSPLYRRGEEAFLTDLKDAGIDGVIVSDLPVEASASYRATARRLDLGTVFLTTPNTTRARQGLVARHADGFVYAVSTTGITGARQTLDPRLAPFLKNLRSLTTTPVLVGFGISRREHAEKLRRHADGLIVASALINLRDSEKKQRALLRGLRQGLDGTGSGAR